MQSAGVPASNGEQLTRELWAKDPDLSGDAIIVAARASNVTRFVCVGCDIPDSKLAIDFAGQRDDCWASVGIHPHEAQRYATDLNLRSKFSALAEQPKVVAIGECGLDYFYEHSPKADQIKVLQLQCELAIHVGLPMIFHVRDALDDFWPIFDSYTSENKSLRGVLHSFTDSAEQLDKALMRGLFIGVNGIATFTKSDAQRAMYRSIPLENIIFETDAPFLTPTPYRGSINQSKYISVIAEFIAKLRGEPLEELARNSTRNALNLFALT
jgi:TatD DNase family protein